MHTCAVAVVYCWWSLETFTYPCPCSVLLHRLEFLFEVWLMTVSRCRGVSVLSMVSTVFLYVCMRVYMCVCVCVCVCVCACACIHCTCVHRSMHVCGYVCALIPDLIKSSQIPSGVNYIKQTSCLHWYWIPLVGVLNSSSMTGMHMYSQLP